MICQKCGDTFEGQCFECSIEEAKSPEIVKIKITESAATDLKKIMVAPSDNEKDFVLVKNWLLKNKPKSLRWCDETVLINGLLAGHVDVHIPEMEVGLNWIFTIISDEDPDQVDDDEMVMVVPFTHRYIQIFNKDWSKPEVEEVREDGQPISVELEGKISEAQEFCKSVMDDGAWEPEVLNKALSDWVWRHVGLSVDFIFDPDLELSSDHIDKAIDKAKSEPLRSMESVIDEMEDNSLQDE